MAYELVQHLQPRVTGAAPASERGAMRGAGIPLLPRPAQQHRSPLLASASPALGAPHSAAAPAHPQLDTLQTAVSATTASTRKAITREKMGGGEWPAPAARRLPAPRRCRARGQDLCTRAGRAGRADRIHGGAATAVRCRQFPQSVPPSRSPRQHPVLSPRRRARGRASAAGSENQPETHRAAPRQADHGRALWLLPRPVE